MYETLEWGDYPSLCKYTDDTPGQDETVQESIAKVVSVDSIVCD